MIILPRTYATVPIFVYDAYVKVMIFVESALGAEAFLYGNVDGDGLLPAGERG